MSNGESTPAPEVRPAATPPPASAGSGPWLFRAAVLVAVVGAVSVIGWSFGMVYFPRQKQARELVAQVERLSAEVDKLDRQWPKAAVEQLTNQLQTVDSKLFEGQADLETWLAGVKEQAAALALDVRADLGQPTPQTAGGRTLAVIPATVSVEIQPARTNTAPASPYQRILRLCQRLTDEDKPRADLAELTVAGGTNSVRRTVLVLNCWTGKEAKP